MKGYIALEPSSLESGFIASGVWSCEESARTLNPKACMIVEVDLPDKPEVPLIKGKVIS